MDWPPPVMPESSAGFRLVKSSKKSGRFRCLAEKSLYNATGYGELVNGSHA
jgi:hypothetical protein